MEYNKKISQIVSEINEELKFKKSFSYYRFKENFAFFDLLNSKMTEKIINNEIDKTNKDMYKVFSRRLINKNIKGWKMTIMKENAYNEFVNIILINSNDGIDLDFILRLKESENKPIIIFKSIFYDKYVFFDSSLIKDKEVQEILNVHKKYSKILLIKYLTELRSVVKKSKQEIYEVDYTNGHLVDEYMDKKLYQVPNLAPPQLVLDNFVSLYKLEEMEKIVDSKIESFLSGE